jgi:uncharacterized membrane protein
MKSKFAIAGHPLHPALVALPIGLFVWTFICDIIYMATSLDTLWYEIAFWTGIAAIVTGLLAALPGFGDYFTLAQHTDARGIATAHMLLNLITVLLFLIAAILMANLAAATGGRLMAVFVLHLLGVGLLALSGWLGGEMVYRHHLATIPEDAEMERAEHARHDLGVQNR